MLVDRDNELEGLEKVVGDPCQDFLLAEASATSWNWNWGRYRIPP